MLQRRGEESFKREKGEVDQRKNTKKNHRTDLGGGGWGGGGRLREGKKKKDEWRVARRYKIGKKRGWERRIRIYRKVELEGDSKS